VQLRNDGVAPDADALGKLLALRTRWFAYRRDADSDANSDWVLALVQAAAGKVLASTEASAGTKEMASRAVAGWIPDSPPPATHTITPGERPAKALKLSSEGGQAIEWTEADDELF